MTAPPPCPPRRPAQPALGRWLGAFLAGLAAVGCGGGERTFSEPMVLGGRRVPADVLNHGELVYRRDCASCHGLEGHGDGRYAARLSPRPRDLTEGEYPHLGATGGDLPTDDELRALVRGGIDGTAMRPLPLPDADCEAVVQYLKTLSPRWRTGA
ncbi:MAG: c-type cytochrome [Sandaracinaceae bacterium]